MFILLLLSQIINASELKLGGFVDSYYAYDLNNPSNQERAFTTQPARHNEFNINLAFIEANLKKEKTRGRLAIQFGNSVSKNYAAEPENEPNGQTGAQDLKNLQEAYIGIKLSEKLWFDMGYFLGNIGMESWISKDNFTYTRSLQLDYVPYYSNGARFEYHQNEKHIFQLQILNGWQNLSETNEGKAIGMQWKWIINQDQEFTYNNFFGDERIVSQKDRFRQYHNFIFKQKMDEIYTFLGSIDFGAQSQQEEKGVNGWGATSMTLNQQFNITHGLAYRLEYYSDANQSNVITNTENGFQVFSASVTYNYLVEENTWFRNELRGFHSKDEIFPYQKNDLKQNDVFFVTSISAYF
jgi:hypothetical protein